MRLTENVNLHREREKAEFILTFTNWVLNPQNNQKVAEAILVALKKYEQERHHLLEIARRGPNPIFFDQPEVDASPGAQSGESVLVSSSESAAKTEKKANKRSKAAEQSSALNRQDVSNVVVSPTNNRFRVWGDWFSDLAASVATSVTAKISDTSVSLAHYLLTDSASSVRKKFVKFEVSEEERQAGQDDDMVVAGDSARDYISPEEAVPCFFETLSGPEGWKVEAHGTFFGRVSLKTLILHHVLDASRVRSQENDVLHVAGLGYEIFQKMMVKFEDVQQAPSNSATPARLG